MAPSPQFWNALAERYAAKPVEDPDAFEKKIAATKALIQPTHRVLDIGCGTGSFCLRLADTGAEIHGLDFASGMIDIAERKRAAQGASNVQFHTDDVTQGFFGFEPGSLDGVFAYSLLHLVEDPLATLERMYALLAPGGYFVSSTLCLADSRIPYRPILTVMRWLGKAPMVHCFRKSTFLKDVRAAGFQDLHEPEVGAAREVAFLVARKSG